MDLPPKFPASILVGEQMELKAVSQKDAPAFFHVIQENQNFFAEFEFSAPSFTSLETVEEAISHLATLSENGKGATYGYWVNQILAGLFKVNAVDWSNRSADIGFWMSQTSTGKGLAYAALYALRDTCIQTLALKKLTASTAISNQKSQKLLLKAGFKNIKLIKSNFVIRGKEVDDFLFAFEAPTK